MKTFTFKRMSFKKNARKIHKLYIVNDFLFLHFLMIISSGIPLFTQNNWNTHAHTRKHTSPNHLICQHFSMLTRLASFHYAVAEINLFSMTFHNLIIIIKRKSIDYDSLKLETPIIPPTLLCILCIRPKLPLINSI